MMVGYPQSLDEYMAQYNRLKARESRQAGSVSPREYRELADAGYYIVFHNGEYLQGQKRNLPGLCSDFLKAYANCLDSAGYAGNPDVLLQVRAGKVESLPAASAAGPQKARTPARSLTKPDKKRSKRSDTRPSAPSKAPNKTPNVKKQSWDEIPKLL